MDKNDIHHQITEELYLEGVRNLLLEYTLSVFNGTDFPIDRDIETVKLYIHNWIEARYPSKIIENKD